MPTSATSETVVDTTSFSAILRRSTRALHDKANHSRYMEALLGGALELDDYARLVSQYYFIYEAIERVSDAMRHDQVGNRFVVDELRRMPALAKDLRYFFGPDWQASIAPLPATKAYADRIAAGSEWAGWYVAHHYTRYLGDIAGGQAIRRTLERVYQLDDGGTNFYQFAKLGNAKAFRDRYRAMLDTAPWDQREQSRIVDEALTAFECNIAVFDELAAELREPAG